MTKIADLKTAQIVAAYNAHAAKPVKKFVDRATAEARLQALMTEKGLTLNDAGEAVAAKKPLRQEIEEAAAARIAKKAAEKKAARAAKSVGGKRGPAPEYADDATITVLAESNPKREGTASYDRFALYAKSATVGAFIKAGGTRADVRWDVAHGHIKVG